MTASPPSDPTRATSELRSYGRRKGRSYGPRQERLLDLVLPQVAVDLTVPYAAKDGDGARSLWLEIGFGGAEHLLWQARQHPEVALIGCEPFRDGVVKALSGIEAFGLSNVQLHADDARPLIRWLPDASLDRVFVLFPDPWPKRKHVKRRLVAPALLDLLARAMKPGAELRVATDIGDYARTILIAVMAHREFQWTAKGPDDWRVRGADWPSTRYEQKALREGRRPAYFRFRRNG